MAANVPATIVSRFYTGTHISSLAIGNTFYPPKADLSTSFYWYTVVDLTNLSVPDVAVSTANDTVPANIAKYLGNSQYFLFFAANMQRSSNIPHGALATFLQQVGSGNALARAEQMINQLGTGNIQLFSYILAATFTTGDLPGFELFSAELSTVLTMQFMPVTVDGKIIYAPIQLGQSGAAVQSK
jgi:hypothetical protein